MSENVQRCAMASSKKPKRAFSINLFGFLDSETINGPWIHWMCRLYPWPTAFRTCWRPWSILSILPFHFKTQPYLYAVVKRHAVIVKTCSFNNLKPLAVPPVAKQASPLLCFLPLRSQFRITIAIHLLQMQRKTTIPEPQEHFFEDVRGCDGRVL